MKCSICKNIGHNKRTCNKRDSCPVCLESMNDKINVAVTPCGHKFCTSCLVKSCSRNGKCPICRYELYNDYMIKSVLNNQERIMTRSLDNFNLVERFPKMIDDEDYKEKIIKDFVVFSNLIIFYSLEEMVT